MKNPIQLLRRITLLEGVSFLLLLGIAMPLKYFAGLPLAVLVFGWLHGLLFVWFSCALLAAKRAAGWPIGRAALVFLAALLPFGPFVIDARLRGWLADFDARFAQQLAARER